MGSGFNNKLFGEEGRGKLWKMEAWLGQKYAATVVVICSNQCTKLWQTL